MAGLELDFGGSRPVSSLIFTPLNTERYTFGLGIVAEVLILRGPDPPPLGGSPLSFHLPSSTNLPVPCSRSLGVESQEEKENEL